jgi:predicted nucleic acid-binding protein
MKLVVDTNILMSAMLSPLGKVSDVFFHHLPDTQLLCPHFVIVELFDKKERIIQYSKLNEADISDLYYQLLKRITFINEDLISDEALQQAYQLVHDIDLKDLSFVALAIHTSSPLWTGDLKLLKKLSAKGFINCLTTGDILG